MKQINDGFSIKRKSCIRDVGYKSGTVSYDLELLQGHYKIVQYEQETFNNPDLKDDKIQYVYIVHEEFISPNLKKQKWKAGPTFYSINEQDYSTGYIGEKKAAINHSFPANYSEQQNIETIDNGFYFDFLYDINNFAEDTLKYYVLTSQKNAVEYIYALKIPLDTLYNKNQRKLITLCKNNELDAVKELIENHEVDLTYDNSEAFYQACQEGHKEIIAYLLSPNKPHVIIKNEHYSTGNWFITLCNNHLDVVEALICDNEIIYSKDIEDVLEKHNHPSKEFINNLFKVQELKNKLTNDLQQKQISRKIKV